MRCVGFLFVVILFGDPADVLADGKVLPTATAKVTIPDQQALIHYADGVERLVIETRFAGSGTDFAWVVPLPAVPEVSEVTPGLFPTLQTLFRPTVIHNIPPYYYATICLFIAAAALLLRRYHWLILVAAILVLASIVLPTLGTAGSGESAAVSVGDSVILHKRQIIGDFEVTTISADRADAMVTWLDANGYRIDDASKAVVADYVNEGWAFAAMKLHRPEDTTEPSTPHPLAFTFPTESPIYPLHLTGINNGPCKVDLYVFGPDRATVPGFHVTECRRTHFPVADGRGRYGHQQRPRNTLPIVHDQLRTLVEDTVVATKLSATLSPEQMTEDAPITWVAFEHAHRTFFSRHGAARITLNIALVILCLGILISLAGDRARPQRNRCVRRRISLAILVALVGSGIAYGVLPTIDVHVSRQPSFNERTHIVITSIIENDPKHAPASIPDETWLADRVALMLDTEEYLREPLTTNPMTGQRIIREDSPGNYGFRVTDAGAEYLWYDRFGAEHSIPLHFIAEPDTSPPSDSQPASAPGR